MCFVIEHCNPECNNGFFFVDIWAHLNEVPVKLRTLELAHFLIIRAIGSSLHFMVIFSLSSDLCHDVSSMAPGFILDPFCIIKINCDVNSMPNSNLGGLGYLACDYRGTPLFAVSIPTSFKFPLIGDAMMEAVSEEMAYMVIESDCQEVIISMQQRVGSIKGLVRLYALHQASFGRHSVP
ncbi:hypothetical protein NE237_033119 [Protea cynaroides]|uniref:Uncharacterized protein n=1 Tax=Protea cynaroides TaxID=273540 RepID=A0A9Q0L4F7_9MAGN|nr:hypothetical protein NE237_033119 [Protea cynaroides]